MVKVILFDADGVLINGEKFSVHLEKDYGISHKQTKTFFTGPFLECVTGKADLKEILPPHLKEWGWKGSVEEFLQYWFTVEHTLDEQLIKYIQTLRKRGILCCIATNQEKYRIAYMLTKMGFDKSFDKLYSSADIGIMKFSKVYYEKVLADLPVVAKNEVLFWDDTEANVKAAKKIGIHAQLYISFDDFKEKMQQYV